MRRTPVLLAAVALAGAAAPAAILAHPSKGEDSPAAQGQRHQHAKLAQLRACVTTNATQASVDLKVLGGNHRMRAALAGATTYTATLDDATPVRLVGRARLAPAGSPTRLLPKSGTWDDLDQGDLVTVRFRVARGAALADFGAATKVIDRGAATRCAVPAPQTPTTPTTTAPAT